MRQTQVKLKATRAGPYVKVPAGTPACLHTPVAMHACIQTHCRRVQPIGKPPWFHAPRATRLSGPLFVLRCLHRPTPCTNASVVPDGFMFCASSKCQSPTPFFVISIFQQMPAPPLPPPPPQPCLGRCTAGCAMDGQCCGNLTCSRNQDKCRDPHGMPVWRCVP